MLHDGSEIDLRLTGFDAQLRGRAHSIGRVGGGQDRFGWHAAKVQAVAPHLAGFKQHHLAVQHGCAGCGDQPGRARANDAQIGLDAFPAHASPPLAPGGFLPVRRL